MPARPYNTANTTPDHLTGSTLQSGTSLRPWFNGTSGAAGGNMVVTGESGISRYEPRPGTMPTTNNPPPRPPGGGGGGGGRGGGGGGLTPINWDSLNAMMNYRPQQFEWQKYTAPQRKANPFYRFNSTQYDQMGRGIEEGLAADLASGKAAYGEARGELERYQNPFAGRDYATNPQMSAAMQRMMQANGVTPDYADQSRGVQADQAFGNVMALLGGAAQNRQAAELRALGGDERRFGESLASQGRTMNLQVQMAEARAREAYEKEKWLYGEEIARQNYEARREAAMYNNQGMNATTQANTQAVNEAQGSNVQMLLDLIAQGYKPPDLMVLNQSGYGK